MEKGEEILKKQSSQIITDISEVNVYYKDNSIIQLNGDCFEIMPYIKEDSVDMVFADPPYFLSGDGITCSSGKIVSVKKGKWDEKIGIDEKLKFNLSWIEQCKRILKDTGTIWISGSMHNIYVIGVCLEKLGFKIINNITWQKTNPPPNMAHRSFTHSTETILWAKKDLKDAKHIFNYDKILKLNNGKQEKDVWQSGVIKTIEKQYGYHPTQKPKWLLEKIIIASTDENNIILDPFSGTGTTAVVSKLLNRKCICIEKEPEYLEISKRRFENETKI